MKRTANFFPIIIIVFCFIAADFSPERGTPFRNLINSAFACGDCGEGCIAATPFVTLEIFTTTLSPDKSKIIVVWETSKETRTLGFNILRARSDSANPVQINDELVRAEGGDAWGAAYVYEDSDFAPDAAYRYYLESKDECGAKYIFGPLHYGECEDCEGSSCFITTISSFP